MCGPRTSERRDSRMRLNIPARKTSIANAVKWTTAALVGLGSLVGCETKAGTGALAGGAGGALVGGLIGSNSHGRAGEGALIGGAVGALGGALVGHSMDKADEERAAADDSRNATREYDRRHASAVRETVSKADVINWTQRGVHDEVII